MTRLQPKIKTSQNHVIMPETIAT